MKILRDYCCKKCKIYFEDHREYEDIPACPDCGKPTEIYISTCNFNSFFEGSHKSQYGEQGKIFQGNCTKESLLKKVSYSERVKEAKSWKKGLKGQEVDDKKHAKKID